MTVRVAIVDGATLPIDPTALSDAERAVLATLRGDHRRTEWIRGRIALRRVIGDPGISVVADPDGAPRAIGIVSAPFVSLSHDGDWYAVAVGDAVTRVGIDLCMRAQIDRVQRVLSGGRFDLNGVTPLHAWVAIEAVLKLRRRPVTSLLAGGIVTRTDGEDVVVAGIAAPVRVAIREEPAFVVGYASSSHDAE